METKVCTHDDCFHKGDPQPIDSFSHHKRYSDGRQVWCKDCMAEAQRAYRQTAKTKASIRKYTQSDKFKAQQKRYAQSEKGRSTKRQYTKTEKFRIQVRHYQKTANDKERRRLYRKTEKYKALMHRRYERVKDHPEYLKRHIARLQVKYAIIRGNLLPIGDQLCLYCQQPAHEYHHYLGYDQEHWLDVVPTCRSCHRRIDRGVSYITIGVT